MKIFRRNNVSIALLDDHFLVLRGLSDVLRENPDFKVVGTFTSSKELLNCIKNTKVDVIIADYELAPADIDGLNLIKTLNRLHPRVAVLVVSAHYNPATVALALRGGAKGFIGKNRPFDEIQNAALEVSRGRTFIEPQMAQELANQQRHGEVLISGNYSEANVRHAVSLSALSPKEQEVIRCFLAGMTVTDIAEKFNRSLKTISGQKQSAMRKLGLKADHELFIIKDELLKSLHI
ncbi:response regulator transcription factor [Pantoea sp. SS70]|uniref:response regulator transcription factor n=1 Tax=Pantoea sp. SS70 TaxID=3024247 RepID=UPI0024536057|nr:response regulator transcription factor [Pantoea sp. SS70]WGK60076.1 response regulator transcription factor [Pantoea sp. SS70]